MKILKVKDLIKLLSTVNQNASIILEGCDCASPCVGLNVGTDLSDAYSKDVILRTDGGVFQFDGEPVTKVKK